MGLASSSIAFALLATATVSAWDHLAARPILAPGYDLSKMENVRPSSDVVLGYDVGFGSDPGASVTVAIHVNRPAVLLEAVGVVRDVDCTSDGVTVSFSNKDTFLHAMLHWPQDAGLYLITNHASNCDTGSDRGAHYVSGLSWDLGSMTVRAQTERRDLKEIASTLRILISQEDNNAPKPDQDVTINLPQINAASNFSIPGEMVIFSSPPNFTASVNGGRLSNTIAIQGHLEYDVEKQKLVTAWFNMDASLFIDLGLTFRFKGAQKSCGVVFYPGSFSPSRIYIPGILNLQPTLHWSIGADIGSDGPLAHQDNLTANIGNGHVHLDFVNDNETKFTGWTPDFSTSYSTEGVGTAHFSPSIDFTAELAVNVMEGTYSSTGGFTTNSQLLNQISPAAKREQQQGIQKLRRTWRIRKGQQNMHLPRNSTCHGGYELTSSFNLSLVAYVVDEWEETQYSINFPIADQCYYP
ncbi:hypothetical protein GGS23DRAFT_377979 [Durotheca rogersii]|uniref:uncharacterized protein n=1 Tax=Durotheca rogersii TaxID=419775 RepID=UPI00221F5C40|nr:uncharacterized protein GGS23DRAFT_377979 [Durotheca rogersii]KAI5866269.1 hypothetical protein GGS23DRAFT_377979 [Durotheca rogersii]